MIYSVSNLSSGTEIRLPDPASPSYGLKLSQLPILLLKLADCVLKKTIAYWGPFACNLTLKLRQVRLFESARSRTSLIVAHSDQVSKLRVEPNYQGLDKRGMICLPLRRVLVAWLLGCGPREMERSGFSRFEASSATSTRHKPLINSPSERKCANGDKFMALGLFVLIQSIF
jgi:hypothetical protein